VQDDSLDICQLLVIDLLVLGLDEIVVEAEAVAHQLLEFAVDYLLSIGSLDVAKHFGAVDLLVIVLAVLAFGFVDGFDGGLKFVHFL